MGNEVCRICLEKNQKCQLFLTKTEQKKFAKKSYCRPVNWMVFHRLVQKHLHFRAYCKDRTQKCTLCPFRNLKKEIFSLKTRRKKLQWPKQINDSFYRPPVTSAECLPKTEKYLEDSINLNYPEYEYCQGYGQNASLFRHFTKDDIFRRHRTQEDFKTKFIVHGDKTEGMDIKYLFLIYIIKTTFPLLNLKSKLQISSEDSRWCSSICSDSTKEKVTWYWWTKHFQIK